MDYNHAVGESGIGVGRERDREKRKREEVEVEVEIEVEVDEGSRKVEVESGKEEIGFSDSDGMRNAVPRSVFSSFFAERRRGERKERAGASLSKGKKRKEKGQGRLSVIGNARGR